MPSILEPVFRPALIRDAP